jgi:hypothetical protein
MLAHVRETHNPSLALWSTFPAPHAIGGSDVWVCLSWALANHGEIWAATEYPLRVLHASDRMGDYSRLAGAEESVYHSLLSLALWTETSYTV